MKVVYLSNEQEYAQWDRFLQENPRGHYAQLSTWLKSYEAYGASKEILAIKKEDRIVGGLGLTVFGKGPLKVVTVPMAPIVDQKEEELCATTLVEEAIAYAKKIGAFLFQIQFPYASDVQSGYLLSSIDFLQRFNFQTGMPFRIGTVPNLLFLVDLLPEISKSDQWEEKILATFKRNTRRDIRKALRNGLEIRELYDEKDLKRAYAVIEDNGREQGYAVRSWEQFGPTLTEQVEKKQAVLLTAWKGEMLLGAHYGVIAGRRYAYSMGGTRRIEKDYLVGHFLHWNVMKKAKEMGLEAYDFTSLGSPGVLRFKQGFRPMLITFDDPRYLVLNKAKFFLFSKGFPYLKKHKALFAKIAHAMAGKS